MRQEPDMRSTSFHQPPGRCEVAPGSTHPFSFLGALGPWTHVSPEETSWGSHVPLAEISLTLVQVEVWTSCELPQEWSKSAGVYHSMLTTWTASTSCQLHKKLSWTFQPSQAMDEYSLSQLHGSRRTSQEQKNLPEEPRINIIKWQLF